MLDRPRIVKEGKEAEEEEDDDEDEEDEELPSYLREQSSDEEHAALYSKNKLNANGESSLHLYSTLLYSTLSCYFVTSHIVHFTVLFSYLLFYPPIYQSSFSLNSSATFLPLLNPLHSS